MPKRIPTAAAGELETIFSELAAFRYQLRKFLRFSETAARQAGITAQQHQLLLGIAGFNGTGKATISELAEFLQEKHHSVVGLIDRAEASGLVRRESAPSDRRIVLVTLTTKGKSVLERLSRKHLQEVHGLQLELLKFRQPQPASGAPGSHLKTKESPSPTRL